jgi:hypothetical protein
MSQFGNDARAGRLPGIDCRAHECGGGGIDNLLEVEFGLLLLIHTCFDDVTPISGSPTD